LLVFCALAATLGRAQAQAAAPAPGFVSPYEITRIAVSAGFDPLAPPMREGTTYVLRATDYRGILMRVVIDARTGAIRDANRIVPGPGRYGQYGMMSPYDPPDFDVPDVEPPMLGPPLGHAPPSSAYAPPPAFAPPSHAGAIGSPPLPRPRPAGLKPALGSEVSTAAPPPSQPPQAAPAGTHKPAPVEPLND
jgi:hypothetical protein